MYIDEGCIRKGFSCESLSSDKSVCLRGRDCKGCYSYQVDRSLLKENYNNEYYINEYVRDLDALHEVINLRRNKGAYGEKLRLSDIKILDNLIWLDSCGNAMVKIKRDTYSPIPLPQKDDKCPICGKAWSIYNLEDVVTNTKYEADPNGGNFAIALNTFSHKQCNFINHLNEKQKQFTDIFDSIYPKEYTFKVVPNEYCQCEVCAPWFIFSTPDGDIKIGWRKRVINIQWLNTYSRFSETFNNEDVTKWFNDSEGRGIHAWSEEKCVEYLLRAKSSINR
jgi:hypothetical protein